VAADVSSSDLLCNMSRFLSKGRQFGVLSWASSTKGPTGAGVGDYQEGEEFKISAWYHASRAVRGRRDLAGSSVAEKR